MGTIARRKGLGTIYVTNGYITEEGLREIAPMLGAYRVDIKAFTDDFYKKICGARLQPVLDSAALARELGMHVETVTLVIPGLNDSTEEMGSLIRWVIEHLGPATPMHFSAFHPDYKMTDRGATPPATLEKIYDLAKESGSGSRTGQRIQPPVREHLLPGLRGDAHRAAGIFEPNPQTRRAAVHELWREDRDRATCPEDRHLSRGSSPIVCSARSAGTSVYGIRYRECQRVGGGQCERGYPPSRTCLAGEPNPADEGY